MFHRWGPYTLLGFGLLMAIPTSEVVGMDRGDWYTAGAMVATGVLLQLWWGATLHARPGPTPASALYYVLRWAAAFVLSWLNPFFAFYAVVGYFGTERMLPPRLVRLGRFATAVTMAGSQSGGMPPEDELGWVVFGGLLAVNIALLIVFAHLADQEDRRARDAAVTITELERTDTALQQAMDENAALHAQLLVQAREAGVADERRRLAAEIHDTIAQGLTGIIAQLQVVSGARDEKLAREHLDRAADLARHSLGEARRSVHNLSLAPLEHDRLPEALDMTGAQWAQRTGIRAHFTVTGTAEPLHDEIEATLLRIVQEAPSNTARHAEAARLGVTLSFMGDEVTLDVRDRLSAQGRPARRTVHRGPRRRRRAHRPLAGRRLPPRLTRACPRKRAAEHP
ncbi:sensor histidine kinase [Streptomyces venezuelae]|uniref:sensor histidine kinase n=1 Tax=Streptomyces venezuelae TaxID=54571 RepID=UPI00123B4649|nr:histidine kinase [Streptomyces venezuelae]